MKALSKSSILALRQCRRRLWLELNRPELRADSPAARARFAAGRQVGEVARRLYDPWRTGTLLDSRADAAAALERTRELLRGKRPIFEAGFSRGGVTAFADVMLPHRKGLHAGWRMVEVKSAAGIKPQHVEDVALQSWVAAACGVRLGGVVVAHVDSRWTYAGGGNYRGLLVENDVSDRARALHAEVPVWIEQAEAVARMHQEPEVRMGRHCGEPYECGFMGHCRASEPAIPHPVHWLPNARSKRLLEALANPSIASIEQVPDELLNEQQQRVKTASMTGLEYFDAEGAARALRGLGPPAYFLDFETTQFAVPVWPGTRPYQAIPFQFSVHALARDESIAHVEHLDLGGFDPRRGVAEALLAACGERGPVFAYNAAFERGVIEALAGEFPELRRALLALVPRLVDLRPIAEAHYYHPSQQGSWSFKRVLPGAFPDLSYAKLEGVADGDAASQAYREAIAPETSSERRERIAGELRRYCALDTFGLVKLYLKFAGRPAVAVAVPA